MTRFDYPDRNSNGRNPMVKPIAYLAIVLAVCFAYPATASAQTVDGSAGGGSHGSFLIKGDEVTSGQPRDNVKLGGIGARLPGNRLKKSIARSSTFQANSLRGYGGATYVSKDSLPEPLERTVLLIFLDSLNDLLTLWGDFMEVILRPTPPVPV